MGRLKHVGAWGRIALEVPESGSSYKVVNLANPDDAERFQIGDVVFFDVDVHNDATNLRKPSKQEPLPKSFKVKT